MKPSDAARILAVAAAFDRRTVGETDAQAWADALDELDPRLCAAAVRQHYRHSTDWVMPAHVRTIIADHRKANRDREDTAKFIAEQRALGRRPMPDEARQIIERTRTAIEAKHDTEDVA